MTFGPTHADLCLAHTNLCPAHTDLCPAHADLGLARAKNQPKLTPGALFHGYFHALRWV